MTNPDNIVRVRARRGGRASVYEANGWCQAFSQGVLDGVGVIPNTVPDLNVLVGGTPTCPDVVIATNPAGYKIALDIVGQQAVTLTAPASNSRISAIVAYTDDLALSTTENKVTGSPATCGLIVVNSAASANPVSPTDTEIRAAITADGAAGSQASYAVIAEVTVSASTTLITESLISISRAAIMSSNIDFEALTLVAATTSVTSVGVDETAVIQKLRLPAGKWKVTGQFNGSSAQAQVYIADISLWAGSDIFSNITVCGVGSTMASISILPIAGQTIGAITVNSPIDIALTIRAREHSIQVVYPKGCWLIAERIG